MPEWKKARTRTVQVEFREVEPVLTLGTMNMKGETLMTETGAAVGVAGRDFIIRLAEGGQLYPITKDIFWQTYETEPDPEIEVTDVDVNKDDPQIGVDFRSGTVLVNIGFRPENIPALEDITARLKSLKPQETPK